MNKSTKNNCSEKKCEASKKERIIGAVITCVGIVSAFAISVIWGGVNPFNYFH